jgi:hypothetical protein
MKKHLLLLLFVFNSFVYAQEFPVLKGDYLGQAPPGDTPIVFARGIVSTDNTLSHSAPAFSPDGNEVFWLLNRPPRGKGGKWLSPMMMTMRRVGDVWTAPVVAPFLGEPVFSIDGKRFYFTHCPTLDTKDVGPYFVEKKGNSWSEPKSVGLIARFPELQFVYDLSIARNGTLYILSYAAGQSDNYGNHYGIYRAELINGEYAKPELLPPGINKPGTLNWTPFIAPDESYLLFSSSRRSSNDGGDLYVCFRKPDGSWTDAVSLGATINSDKQERFPAVSPDGKYLFFTREIPDHDDDVFWVSAKIIDRLRENNNIKK